VRSELLGDRGIGRPEDEGGALDRIAEGPAEHELTPLVGGSGELRVGLAQGARRSM
jgi:hypothetical protein